MLEGVAVAFGSGGDEIFGVVFFCDFEGIESSERSDAQRGDAMEGVIDRAGGAGEVEDVIDLTHVEGFADVLFYKLASWLVVEVS